MLRSHYIALVLFALLCHGYCDTKLMAGVIRMIFSNIFQPKSLSLTIIANNTNAFVADTLDAILKANTKINVPIAINQPSSATVGNYIAAAILFVEKLEDIKDNLHRISMPRSMSTVKTKFIIVLISHNNHVRDHIEIHKIFIYFFAAYIIDINILIIESAVVNMYTFYPFSSDCCFCVKPTLLQSFKEIPQSLTKDDVYPVKTNNFYNCSMTVVMWNIPPYMQIIQHQDGSLAYRGFDASILKEISEAMNFSVQMMPNEPPDYISGTVYDNETASGVFKILIERRANISLGCMTCLGSRLRMTSGSSSYFIIEYVLLLKNSVRLTSFELVVQPFNADTWYLILIVLALKLLLHALIWPNLKIRMGFRNIFFLLWILFLFLLRLSYEGSMFQIMNNPPYEPLPQTIAALISANYSIKTDYASYRILEDIEWIAQNTKVIEGSPAEVIQSIDHQPQKTAILTTTAYVMNFMRYRLSNHSEYVLLREKVTNGINCIYFPKFSFLIPTVNEVISKLTTYGFRKKYSKSEIGFEKLPPTTDKLVRMRRLSEKCALDFNFIEGILRRAAYSYCVAFIVFVFEIISFRFKYLRDIMYRIM